MVMPDVRRKLEPKDGTTTVFRKNLCFEFKGWWASSRPKDFSGLQVYCPQHVGGYKIPCFDEDFAKDKCGPCAECSNYRRSYVPLWELERDRGVWDWGRTTSDKPGKVSQGETIAPSAGGAPEEPLAVCPVEAEAIRRTLSDEALVNMFWMHRSPETWNPFTVTSAHKAAARRMVSASLMMNANELLVDAVGSESAARVRRWTVEVSRFNPLATFLNVNDGIGLQCCQRKECTSGQMRFGSEGPPEQYRGALFCEDCMPANYDDSCDCVELTWRKRRNCGGRMYERQFRQLLEAWVLPLGGMGWTRNEQYIDIPPQQSHGKWARGEKFSNAPTSNPSGSALRQKEHNVGIENCSVGLAEYMQLCSNIAMSRALN